MWPRPWRITGKQNRSTAARSRGFVPAVEVLEDRTVPSGGPTAQTVPTSLVAPVLQTTTAFFNEVQAAFATDVKKLQELYEKESAVYSTIQSLDIKNPNRVWDILKGISAEFEENPARQAEPNKGVNSQAAAQLTNEFFSNPIVNDSFPKSERKKEQALKTLLSDPELWVLLYNYPTNPVLNGAIGTGSTFFSTVEPLSAQIQTLFSQSFVGDSSINNLVSQWQGLATQVENQFAPELNELVNYFRLSLSPVPPVPANLLNFTFVQAPPAVASTSGDLKVQGGEEITSDIPGNVEQSEVVTMSAPATTDGPSTIEAGAVIENGGLSTVPTESVNGSGASVTLEVFDGDQLVASGQGNVTFDAVAGQTYTVEAYVTGDASFQFAFQPTADLAPLNAPQLAEALSPANQANQPTAELMALSETSLALVAALLAVPRADGTVPNANASAEGDPTAEAADGAALPALDNPTSPLIRLRIGLDEMLREGNLPDTKPSSRSNDPFLSPESGDVFWVDDIPDLRLKGIMTVESSAAQSGDDVAKVLACSLAGHHWPTDLTAARQTDDSAAAAVLALGPDDSQKPEVAMPLNSALSVVTGLEPSVVGTPEPPLVTQPEANPSSDLAAFPAAVIFLYATGCAHRQPSPDRSAIRFGVHGGTSKLHKPQRKST